MIRKVLTTICCVLCFIVISINCVSIDKVVAENNLDIKAKSSILVESETGQILYENNSNEKLQVASIVKLMTSLLVLENVENDKFSLNDEFIVSQNAASMGGSQAFLDANSKYKVYDLLKSVIVASANDSSVALAEYISGSEKEFVKLMNKKAKELNMNNTHYVNCTGLGEFGQYSTVKDVAKILSIISKNDIYKKFSNIWIDYLIHPSGRKTELVNTNKLIKYFDGCECGKTGSTDEAGFCLAVKANRNDMSLISVVLGTNSSKERFSNSSKLLNYGFTNYEKKQIVNKNEPYKEINVSKSSTKKVKIYPDEDFDIIVRKNANPNIEIKVENINKISAPINNNFCVGKLILKNNDLIIKEINLIIKEKINNYSIKEAIYEILDKWTIV